jgi:hypothetical protein
MSLADVQAPPRLSAGDKLIYKVGWIGLFCVLAAYTLTTLDDIPLQRFMMSAVILGFAAVYLLISFRQPFRWSVPAVCLLLMTCYGIGQTIWSHQKILYNGWVTTLFWFTAAVIAVIATQVFQGPGIGRQFRFAFACFGSAVCLFDLLEQASHTGKYYWIFESVRHAVFGPFAYYNNFAEFTELVLPVTLWFGLGQRKTNYLFLGLGALQIGAVVASSSRAGTAMVFLELIAVMAIAYFRRRNTAILPALGLTLLLSIGFTLVAGYDNLITKLKMRDQLATRREINQSSLAMIRERPLTGWGLGSYVPVYPMFATYDDGTWVNRAHNDWLEWTAEGGIFFSSLMLVVFVWSIRPAVRTGWAIGLIAVCLHAIVDYPFARMGVCGWYFALAGMLAVRGADDDDDEPRRHKRRRRSKHRVRRESEPDVAASDNSRRENVSISENN